MARASTQAQVLHDVVIIGGGLVGASLAIALQHSGVDVALVEANADGALPAVFDQRNLSFADATVNALTALGVSQALHGPVGDIQRIHISRAGDFGRVRLDASDYGRRAFGQVVVASDLGQALEQRLRALPGLVRYRPAHFIGLGEVVDGRRSVRVADGEGERVLAARLVVGADGSASMVRDALAIQADRYDYGQVLFVCRMRAQRPPDGTAFERFTADGPTALLPRGDRHYGLVHAVARHDADAVAALDEAAFVQRVQRALGWRVGRIVECGPRSRYPAIQVLARASIAPHAVLIGNAAQTLHPNGAQGFNLGLRDALMLAELIQQRGLDGLGQGLLEDYQRLRETDRRRTVAFTDGMARMTANDAAILRPLRALGMLLTDRLPMLQAGLVGGAMGYCAEVPALCRRSVQ